MHDIFQAEGGLQRAGHVAHVSYFEIFNERVMDLLATGPSGRPSPSLAVKEDVEKGFFVQGLCEAPVHSAKDVLRLIERGEERRRYAHTRWNEYSSRSHVLFNLTLEKLPEPDAASQCEGPSFFSSGTSKLSIVDLAGCENHKFEATEDGRYINRSLFFLGEVISRLCTGASREAGRSASRRSAREGTPTRRLLPQEPG